MEWALLSWRTQAKREAGPDGCGGRPRMAGAGTAWAIWNGRRPLSEYRQREKQGRTDAAEGPAWRARARHGPYGTGAARLMNAGKERSRAGRMRRARARHGPPYGTGPAWRPQAEGVARAGGMWYNRVARQTSRPKHSVRYMVPETETAAVCPPFFEKNVPVLWPDVHDFDTFLC